MEDKYLEDKILEEIKRTCQEKIRELLDDKQIASKILENQFVEKISENFGNFATQDWVESGKLEEELTSFIENRRDRDGELIESLRDKTIKRICRTIDQNDAEEKFSIASIKYIEHVDRNIGWMFNTPDEEKIIYFLKIVRNAIVRNAVVPKKFRYLFDVTQDLSENYFSDFEQNKIPTDLRDRLQQHNIFLSENTTIKAKDNYWQISDSKVGELRVEKNTLKVRYQVRNDIIPIDVAGSITKCSDSLVDDLDDINKKLEMIRKKFDLLENRYLEQKKKYDHVPPELHKFKPLALLERKLFMIAFLRKKLLEEYQLLHVQRNTEQRSFFLIRLKKNFIITFKVELTKKIVQEFGIHRGTAYRDIQKFNDDFKELL